MQQEKNLIWKYLLYIAVLLVLFILETSLPMKLSGFHIDVLPCVALSVALLEGPLEGVVFGLLTGMLYDVGYGGAEGLLPLFYMLCGAAAGVLSQRYLRRILPSLYLLTASVQLLLGFFRYAYSWLEQRPTQLLLFLQQLCGETLVSIVFSTLVYFGVQFISNRYVKQDQ